MKSFWLVGVNGEDTPDPDYWRARNEFVEAESKEEAKAKWIKMREGWYAGEPVTIEKMTKLEEHERYSASRWLFTDKGPMKLMAW